MDYRNLQKESLIVLLVIIITLSFWSGAKYTKWRLSNEPLEIVYLENTEESNQTKEKEKIFVHVAGAVKNPGVYTLPVGSRVEDVLELAQPIIEADVDRFLNRAAILKDSDKIYIPNQEELNEQTPEGIALPTAGGLVQDNRININQATQKQLEELPGIGPAKAKAIVDYRQNNGAFQNIEAIMNVKGIGPAIFENLKQQITV